MKELKVNGTQEFMGKEIKVIEGGFGEDCKVIIDKQLSEIHNMETSEIRKSINRLIVKNRLVLDIDYIDLKSIGKHFTDEMKLSFGYNNNVWSKAGNIFVLSERGYSKLIKSMDDDLSWNIMDKFVDEYFAMRKEVSTFKLPQTYKEALIELVVQVEKNEILELENKKQQEVIEMQKPKADYFDCLVETNLLTGFRDCSKELGIKQNEFMKFLEEKKFIYRDKRDKPKPYAQHVDSGLFELRDFTSGSYSDVRTFITVKGKETFRLLLQVR